MMGLLCLFAFRAYQQTPQTNLEKYWTFRERLKNFVVVGNCQGCGIPAVARQRDLMGYDDAGVRLAYYVSVLATEYKLLKDHGETQKLLETKRELFFAMETMNRLDKMAEFHWRVANGTPVASAGPFPQDLNGFFIRDDVDSTFASQVVDGKLVENLLSSSFFPFQDCLDPIGTGTLGVHVENYESHTKISSGFTSGMAGDFGTYPSSLYPNDGFKGPKEESLDQANQWMMALALIVKCVDPSDSHNNIPFTEDPTITSFVTEAKRISNRVVMWMDSHHWTIVNTAVPGCAQGVWNTRSCLPGAPGGGGVQPLKPAFALANMSIQDGFTTPILTNIVNLQSTFQDVTSLAAAIFIDGTRYISAGIEDEKIVNLGAIGNIWGASTRDVIEERLFRSDLHREHVSLLYNILWGAPTIPSLFECMLNAAPCLDKNAHTGSYEWGITCRINDRNDSNLPSLDSPEGYGIDYMLYFNMYAIANPGYMSGIYKFIPPKEIAFDNLVKTDNEWDTTQVKNDNNETSEKHFIAANKISAGDIGNTPGPAKGYKISNHNKPSDPPVLGSPAHVTFEAGKEIELANGFSVEEGAFFNATIDPTIHARTCNTNPGPVVCTQCHSPGHENLSGSAHGEYKVYPADGTDMYVATPHILYKISGTGGTGSNMFDMQGTAPNVTGTYVVGSQQFNRTISDVDYINNYTFVSFTDGTILKIDHTGGTGAGMFGIYEVSSSCCPFSSQPIPGTSPTAYYDYYVGDMVFQSGVTQLEYFSDNHSIMIGFDTGKLLKVSAPGGTGHNLFAVTESNSSCCPFNTVSGYNYYVGDAWDEHAAVVNIYQKNSNETIICYASGYIQKIFGNGAGTGTGNGGTGHGMLSGYVAGTNTNIGAAVTKIIPLNPGWWLVCFADGNILRSDLDGSGQGFLAVNPAGGGFNAVILGHYGGDMNASAPVTDGFMDDNGKLLLSFANGKVLKIGDIYSSASHNMFAVIEDNSGFSSASGYHYYEGSCNFDRKVCQMTRMMGNTFITFNNAQMLKLQNNLYGTGYNFMGLSNSGNFLDNLCGYYNLIGCQDFNPSHSYKIDFTSDPLDLYNPHAAENASVKLKTQAGDAQQQQADISALITVDPNPSTGQFLVRTPATADGSIEVFDELGRKVQAVKLTQGVGDYPLNLSGHAPGIYLLNIATNDNHYAIKKVVLE